MAATPLTARRVTNSIPIWDILAGGIGTIGSLTNLPMEGAWCLTAGYRGRTFDFRAASREAVLLALRCAVDAADHAAEPYIEDYVEDEDGEIARMRHDENLAERFAMRYDMQEPY